MKKAIALTTMTLLLAALVCGVAWAGELTQTGTCFLYRWLYIGPRRVCVWQRAHCCTDGTTTYKTELRFSKGQGEMEETIGKIETEKSNKCDRRVPKDATSATGIMTATCTTCGESSTLVRHISW